LLISFQYFYLQTAVEKYPLKKLQFRGTKPTGWFETKKDTTSIVPYHADYFVGILQLSRKVTVKRPERFWHITKTAGNYPAFSANALYSV